MTVIIILLSVITGTGALLYLHHRLTGGDSAPDRTTPPPATSDGGHDAAADDGCCGMHITCERDSLLSSVSTEIEYFDDEELDRFAGRNQDDYSESETEEFREILLSMPADNIAPWARSLQLRGIELPGPVRDELMLIVSEARAARTGHNKP